jgi:prevent-host-death family protein
MRTMTASSFKVHCLAIVDEVQAKRESVVITKRGKPVANLVPASPDAGDIYGFLRSKGTITVMHSRSLKTGAASSDSCRYIRLAFILTDSPGKQGTAIQSGIFTELEVAAATLAPTPPNST